MRISLLTQVISLINGNYSPLNDIIIPNQSPVEYHVELNKMGNDITYSPNNSSPTNSFTFKSGRKLYEY